MEDINTNKKKTPMERIIDFNKDKKQIIYYLEREIFPQLSKKAQEKWLSISAYSRWVIKKDLLMVEENTVEADIKMLKQAMAKLYGMIKPTTTN